MTRPLTPENQTLERSGLTGQDGIFILITFVLIVVIIHTASQFSGEYHQNLPIDTDLSVLPAYTAQTLLRMTVAYTISLIFTLIYAYTAYRFTLAATILIPLLDILQSIPVLSFLPGVVLALITLFPGQRIGIELAAILLIFTGMTWNMTFSFYQSLCSIPRELKEAAKVYRLSGWERFWTLELPSGAIGLVWNSVMSVAGGWFFLIAIESFTLGDKSFQLPGLGSYLATAANQGNFPAIISGLIVLIGVIILMDFLIWRPLIAWVEKFKFQMVDATNVPQSSVLDFIRRSPTLKLLALQIISWQDRCHHYFPKKKLDPKLTPLHRGKTSLEKWVNWLLTGGFTFIILWGIWEAILLLKDLNFEDWKQVFLGAIFTAFRVICALILSLVLTVPIGVAIGRNPRLAQILQPLVQIAASVPATALFPLLLLGLTQIGGGLQIGSIVLMMLGTMWYLLFNVIAGSQAIPSELFEAAEIYKLSLVQRWMSLILPGIFPYLITGIITAVGGAWNASIVSEYVQFKGQVIQTTGLGETISRATATGNFPLLLAATSVMSLLVVLTNRLIWRRLYRLAHEKYQLLV